MTRYIMLAFIATLPFMFSASVLADDPQPAAAATPAQPQVVIRSQGANPVTPGYRTGVYGGGSGYNGLGIPGVTGTGVGASDHQRVETKTTDENGAEATTTTTTDYDDDGGSDSSTTTRDADGNEKRTVTHVDN